MLHSHNTRRIFDWLKICALNRQVTCEQSKNVEQSVWRKSGQIYQLVENSLGMMPSEHSLN